MNANIFIKKKDKVFTIKTRQYKIFDLDYLA